MSSCLAALAALALAAPARDPALPPPRAAPDVLSLARPKEAEWFGLYVSGKKAGYTSSTVRVEQRRGREVFVAHVEGTLRANLGGSSVFRQTSDEKVYEAKPGGRLLGFSMSREGDGGARRVQGTCDQRGCDVVLESNGRSERRRIGPARETVEDGDAARLVAAGRSRRVGAYLDLDRLEVRRVETSFARRSTFAAAGVETPVSIVEEKKDDERVPSVAVVADDGRLLEMRVGEGVVVKAEPEATAKRLDVVDLFGLTRVKLQGPLPRGVPAVLRYRLRGVPPAFAKGDSRQEVASEGQDLVVTVHAELPRAASPSEDPPRGQRSPDPKLLEATPEVDHDDPRIRAFAARVVGEERGTYAAAKRISAAVHDRLRKAYGVSHDRASEVLTSGEGDCTEHTLLFVALARASGIPARQVHGLVYVRYQDDVNALYWHAWPEVLAGSEWIALDPTFGQEVADATHVALGRATQSDTVGLLGGIEVVRVEQVK